MCHRFWETGAQPNPCWPRPHLDVLICLEVASPSMETQDAHEHILVFYKVCHSVAILNLGVLTKLIIRIIDYVLSVYWDIPDMYYYVPLFYEYN